MCIRDRLGAHRVLPGELGQEEVERGGEPHDDDEDAAALEAVSYTHLRAHETVLDLVCRLLLEKKKKLLPANSAQALTLYNTTTRRE